MFDVKQQADDLVEYMGAWGKLRERLTQAGERAQMGIMLEEFVLRHGRLMTDRHLLPESHVRPGSKECYWNAWRLHRRRPRLAYCEGYMAVERCPIPVMHGWCLDAQGKVWDPSIEQSRGAVYFGIQYRADWVSEKFGVLRKRRLIGIMPNWYVFDRELSDITEGIVKEEVANV